MYLDTEGKLNQCQIKFGYLKLFSRTPASLNNLCCLSVPSAFEVSENITPSEGIRYVHAPLPSFVSCPPSSLIYPTLAPFRHDVKPLNQIYRIFSDKSLEQNKSKFRCLNDSLLLLSPPELSLLWDNDAGCSVFRIYCTGVLISPQPDLLPDVFCLMMGNISFDANLVIYIYIYITNIPSIMIINRIFL